MSNSTFSLTIDAPNLPKTASRTHGNSPSRSAKRHHPSLSNQLDPFLRNLSPTTILEAFTAKSQAGPESESLGDDLLQRISHASASERTLGLRAAETLKTLKSLCRELDDWEWTGSFEPPSLPTVVSKAAGVVQEFKIQESFKLRGEADRDMRNADKQEYWGSLPAQQVLTYERRLEAIREELGSLNIEELKDHVLNVHVPSRSRPTSIYGGHDLELAPRPSHYKPLDEVTAVITATTLHSLPYLSRLTQLLNSWSIRVGVLRIVPELLTGLAELQSAISSAWTTIQSPQHGFAAESMDNVDVSRDAFNTVRQCLGHKIADVGRLLDDVLDTVEGRPETIPDAWIDEFERLEEQFGAWVVDAEQRIGESEWRAARETREFNISNASDGLRSAVGVDGAKDRALLHALGDGSDGNRQSDSSKHGEPEQQDTSRENPDLQVPVPSPLSFQFDGGVKQATNTEHNTMGPTPHVKTLATVIRLQTSLHSNLQHSIFSKAETYLGTMAGNESLAGFNFAAEHGPSSIAPGYLTLEQHSPLAKFGGSHQRHSQGRPSNEAGGHAGSDDAVPSDVVWRNPLSATDYPHAIRLDTMTEAEINGNQHPSSLTSSTTETADVPETRSSPITCEQVPEGCVSDSATEDAITQLVSTTLSKLEAQGTDAKGGSITAADNPFPHHDAGTYERQISNDLQQFTLDDTITPPTTESHISATPLGSPWESLTRLPSTDSRVEPDSSTLEKVKEPYGDEKHKAQQHNGQDTSWYYGSDSEAISSQPSLVVQCSSVASTSTGEDSDESDSSLESFQQLSSELKRKDPPQWISTSPPKDRYRHASALTTLSEASTPGSGGYRSDLSSPEIRQASAAEYFVPVEVNTPPPLTRSHSSRSPFYPAAVSATRRANSVRIANTADRTPPGKLRLSIPDASPRLSPSSLCELKDWDLSIPLHAKAGVLKRASITSVESFSRYQVKSVDVKRNTSVSSAASTVVHRPSEDRGRISSSSPERLGREHLQVGDSGSLQSSPSSPSRPVLDNSPSLRLSEKGPGARPPAPVLNAVMHKRRVPRQPEPIEAESVPRSPLREDEAGDAPGANGPKTAQNKLDKRVETILRTISNRVAITPATGYDPAKGRTLKADTPGHPPNLHELKTQDSPAITLSPASAKEANLRHRGETSDIKFYYLKEPGKKDRLLVVRENNNIVVVRVGGGWEELGYHLRTHYGQRSVSQPNVEFQGLPHASATLADSKCSTPTNRPRTAFEGTRSAQSNHKSVVAPRLLTTDMLTTPCSAASIDKRRSITPTSAADAPSGRSSRLSSCLSSRLSWGTSDEPSLAGPYAKKVDVSEEGEQWVQEMVEQARKVSAEKQRGAVDRKIEIADIGKLGAKRRFFLKNAKMMEGS